MISEQDFDRLSAYLDQQLSAREKLTLEARLVAEPELKAALRDLRLQTRALRDLPRLKIPRSFTLTAQQAQAIRPARRSFFETLFPTLRLATSLSAIAFVAVLAVSFFNTPGAPNQTISQIAEAPREAGAPAPASVLADETQAAAESANGAADLIPKTASTETMGFSTLTTGAETPVPELAQAGGTITDTQALESDAQARMAEATPTEGAPAEGETQLYLPGVGNAPPAESAPPASPINNWLVGFGALTVLLAALTWLARRR